MISGMEGRYPRANLHHHSRALMAQHHRQGYRDDLGARHGIGMTDAACRHLHQNLSTFGRSQFNLFQTKGFVFAIQNSSFSFHGQTSSVVLGLGAGSLLPQARPHGGVLLFWWAKSEIIVYFSTAVMYYRQNRGA